MCKEGTIYIDEVYIVLLYEQLLMSLGIYYCFCWHSKNNKRYYLIWIDTIAWLVFGYLKYFGYSKVYNSIVWVNM